MTLTQSEIDDLIKRVKELLAIDSASVRIPDLEEALRYMNIVIEKSTPNALYYSERAIVLARLHRSSLAVDDISRAIDLEPDRVSHYLYRALYSGMEVWNCSKDLNGEVSSPPQEKVKNLIIDFQSVLQKDPTLSEGWIGLIACNILLNLWDNAISFAGESGPFVTELVDVAVRAWMLYLAVIFVGDAVSEVDLSPVLAVSGLDDYFLERIMIHAVTLCCDSKISLASVEHIKTANYLILDRMKDRKRATRLCRNCGYIDKEIELLDRHLNQNPEDYDAWFDKEKALVEIIGRDAINKVWGMNDTRSMSCIISWQMMEDTENYTKFKELMLCDPRNEERLRFLSRVIELNPEYNIAKRKMADLLYDYGRYGQAWNLVDSMRIDDWMYASEGPRDLALFSRGRILEKLCDGYIQDGQYNDALKILDNEITSKTPDEAHLLAGTWYQKARVCGAMGDRMNAIRCLQKAFTLEPEKRNWAATKEDEILKDLLLDNALKPHWLNNVFRNVLLRRRK